MNTPSISPHLVRLSNHDWFLWRTIALRGAGFPVVQPLALADTHAATLADEYLKQLTHSENLFKKAQAVLTQLLTASPQPSDIKPMKKIRWQLKRGRLPSSRVDAEKYLNGLAGQIYSARSETDCLKTQFEKAFVAGLKENVQTLQTIAGNNRFREAVAWQNRDMVENGIDPFINFTLDVDSHLTHKQRYRAAKIAFYLHRFCMKNDTVGYFGPVGWAHVKEQSALLNCQYDAAFLANREVYFELWAIDELAHAIGQNEALRPWCRPRRLPLFDVDSNLQVQAPFDSRLTLTDAQAFVLKSCCGELTAKQLVRKLVKQAAFETLSEAEVYEHLRALKEMGLIEWKLEISAETLYPEESLRQQLKAIDNPALRKQALATFSKVVQCRDEVAQAAGDAETLNVALRKLESTFTEVTGTASTRRAGRTYGSRTLVYEDCRRGAVVNISPTMLDSLGSPLSLVLASARWFTFKAATIYRKLIGRIYMNLVAKTGSSTVNFSALWVQLQPLLFDGNARLMLALRRELQNRWAKILQYDSGLSRIQLRSKDLEPTVNHLFNAPCLGWESACYHSPDVMIMAQDEKAIQDGNFKWVLGEVHAAANTLDTSLWLSQHPSGQDLFQAVENDLPQSIVRLIAARDIITPRRASALIKPIDRRLVVANDSCEVPPSQALLAGTLVVEKENDEIFARPRDGTQRFEIIELLGDVLSRSIFHYFSFITTAQHVPRITVDELIIHRESWRFVASACDFAFAKEAADRFIQVRSWAAANGIPRFFFVKTPVEEKPFYADLASPISIELLSRVTRQTAESDESNNIFVTEMLPDPSHTWLSDSLGNTYTSELRLVIVDRSQSPQP